MLCLLYKVTVIFYEPSFCIFNLAFVASHTCAPCTLLSKEQNVQECDATYDAITTADGYKIISMLSLKML